MPLVLASAVVSFTWPVASGWGAGAFGARYDLWNNLWLLSYFFKSFARGDFTFFSRETLYPAGKSLLTYGHFLIQGLAAPLGALMPVTAAYNTALVISLVLSMYCAFLLMLRLTKSPVPSLIGGGLFALSPYVFNEMSSGVLELTATFFIPLTVLHLLKTRDEERMRNPLVACLCLIGASLTNWYFGFALYAFTTIFLLWNAYSFQEKALRTRFLVRMAVLAGAFTVVMAPLVVQVNRHMTPRPPVSRELLAQERLDGAPTPGASEQSFMTFSRDKLPAVYAQDLCISSFSVSNFFRLPFGPNPTTSSYSYLLLALALAGLIAAGRRMAFWGACAGALFILSLGPFVMVSSIDVRQSILGVPLPYYYFYNLAPVFRYFFRPYRLMVIVNLCLAVPAAFGAHYLLEKCRSHGARIAAAALMLLLFIAESHLFYPRTVPRAFMSTAVPEYYRHLAREPGLFGVIDLPFYPLPQDTWQARNLYYQTAHGKGVLAAGFLGYSNLLDIQKITAESSFLQWLLLLEERDSTDSFAAKDLDAFVKTMGYRRVILHTAFPEDPFHLTGYPENRAMKIEKLSRGLAALCGEGARYGDGIVVFDLEKAKPLPARDGMVRGLASARRLSRLELVEARKEAGSWITLEGRSGYLLHPPVPLREAATAISLWVRADSPGAILEVRTVPDAPMPGRDIAMTRDWTWHRLELRRPLLLAGLTLEVGAPGAAPLPYHVGRLVVETEATAGNPGEPTP